MARRRPILPVERRFLSHVVEQESGCWEWAGSRSNGYGQFATRDGAIMKAHIFAFLMWRGEYDQSLDLDHTCRNRCCVNPAHLEPVTRLENLRRSPLTSAGRGHCPDCGGAYERWPSGRSFCRPCTNEKQMRNYHRRKEQAA